MRRKQDHDENATRHGTVVTKVLFRMAKCDSSAAGLRQEQPYFVLLRSLIGPFGREEQKKNENGIERRKGGQRADSDRLPAET